MLPATVEGGPAMAKNWMDLTLRVKEDAEVDVEPDKTVELSWPIGGSSRATVLLEPEAAKRLSQRLAELVVLIPTP